MKLESKIDEYYKKINDIGTILGKKYKKTAMDKDKVNRTISVINEDSKILLKFTYHYVGSYDIDKELWLWSRNNFSLDNKEKEYVKLIEEFTNNLLIDITKYSDDGFVEKAYNCLKNDVSVISHKNIFGLMKLILYILKGNGVISDYDNTTGINRLDFYVVKDIILNNV